MAALKPEVKAFIVSHLACYDSPSTVVDLVKDEFHVVVTRQQVEGHDPTKKAGCDLAQKWITLFNTVREKFKEQVAEIPIAHKAVRLRRLDRMFSKAESMKNLPLAAQLLEQAAKEVGEHYTNRQKVEHTSPDGSMSPQPPATVTPEVVKALAEKLTG